MAGAPQPLHLFEWGQSGIRRVPQQKGWTWVNFLCIAMEGTNKCKHTFLIDYFTTWIFQLFHKIAAAGIMFSHHILGSYKSSLSFLKQHTHTKRRGLDVVSELGNVWKHKGTLDKKHIFMLSWLPLLTLRCIIPTGLFPVSPCTGWDLQSQLCPRSVTTANCRAGALSRSVLSKNQLSGKHSSLSWLQEHTRWAMTAAYFCKYFTELL